MNNSINVCSKYKVGEFYYNTQYNTVFVVSDISKANECRGFRVYIKFIDDMNTDVTRQLTINGIYDNNSKHITKLTKEERKELFKNKKLHEYLVEDNKLNRILFPDRKQVNGYLISCNH